jgi:seryl-tRNA synthetase
LKKIDKIADENFETLDKELEKLKEENNELKEKVKNLENLINFKTFTIPEAETPKLTMRKNWSEEENQMLISHWKKGKSIQFIKEEVLPEKTYDSIITKINSYIKNKVIKQIIYDYSNDGKGYSDDECNYILEEVKNGTPFIEIAKYLKRKESAIIQKYYNLIKE